MEVISKEISTRNTISFNMNFDSLLEKYQEQGHYKLFYKQNFTISLEYGTNYPGYIIFFHLIDTQGKHTMNFSQGIFIYRSLLLFCF